MNEIELSSWQSKVWLDKTRYKVVNCGRRAGKTVVSAVKMLDFAGNNQKSIVWYVAPTYRQAKSIMWEILKEIIPQWQIASINETELKIVLTNGSQIHLKGGDNPDSLRGVRIDFLICDEVAFFSYWEESWKVIRPTLSDSQASAWFISTPNGFNHFKDLADRCVNDKDWKYFHFTTYDNPHIKVEEIESAKLEMDEDSFAQEYMAEFKKMSGLIYKIFNRDTHMVDVPFHKFDTNWTFTRVIDFGFGHKTALGYFAINSTGTEIYMYDGLYQSGLVPQDIAIAVKIKDAGRNIINPVADNQEMIVEAIKREGVVFNMVQKGPKSVEQGIPKVAELLKIRQDTGKPTLMFNKNLTWVADEFESYRWIENKSDGFIKEVPLKRNDDAMDMIRYFAMEYQKPVVISVNKLPQYQPVIDSDLGF